MDPDALDFLSSDPRLRAVLDEHGVPPPWSRPEGFEAIAYLILEQQVSLDSAAATHRRLRAAIGAVDPAAVRAAGEPAIRAAGVTRQKARYLVALAGSFLDGFDPDRLRAADDEEVRERLTGLLGVGRWTADVYLMSSLGRPDVWPSGDRALLVATAEALGLSSVPSPAGSEVIAARWRPHRSDAARILWHGYLRRRGREPADALG